MITDPLDVMAPVTMPSGKTVWVKVGMVWPPRAGAGHVGTLSLLTLPVGAVAPVDLYLYPPKPARKRPYTRDPQTELPEYNELDHDYGDVPGF